MSDAEVLCRSTYQETADFYNRRQSIVSPENLGFRILYGPPFERSPILFVGFQPGGKIEQSSDWQVEGHHERWPSKCDYAHASWPLARRMRAIWGANLLARCTGTNAIFFRAKTVRDWRRIDRATRLEAEAFSRERAERIAKALNPRRVVVIGLGTFSMLAEGGDVALQNGPRVLAKSGQLWGLPATGIIHLSGARVSRVELDQLRSFFENSN